MKSNETGNLLLSGTVFEIHFLLKNAKKISNGDSKMHYGEPFKHRVIPSNHHCNPRHYTIPEPISEFIPAISLELSSEKLADSLRKEIKSDLF